MPLLNWNQEMSVGVRAFDDDHKRLVGMLNSLFDAMKGGQGRVAVGKILDDLIHYTEVHFAREESSFLQTGYPATADHKKEHKELVLQAKTLQTRYRNGEPALSTETLDFLKDWLSHHINGSDKQYSAHLNANGVR